MANFKQLVVWRKGHELTLAVYRETQAYPPEETYGLKSQTRRAAASIAANLAEGCGRNSDAELVRFARIAQGSANELEYHLLLARDLHLIDAATHQQLEASVHEVERMLSTLIRRLDTKPRTRGSVQESGASGWPVTDED